ncbi:MAG: tetrahydromethanopterin S-methyltransferase subunit A [Thermoplasmata archaeon]|nr:tetrahydromethanopterin S-methyltransferase subunit A [Thermoplasmata archaeon]
MEAQYYPWGGEFVTGNPDAPIAVVTLAKELRLPLDRVAIHGKMRTENLGIEKVVANVISNPHIRFLIIFGEEIRGHRAGGSLIALHRNGIDEARKIIKAPGAVPYIENIDNPAIERFREQVELIDLLNSTKMDLLMKGIDECNAGNPGCFGEPYIAIRFKDEIIGAKGLADILALHNSILVSPFLEVTSMETRNMGIRLHSLLLINQYGRVESA